MEEVNTFKIMDGINTVTLKVTSWMHQFQMNLINGRAIPMKCDLHTIRKKTAPILLIGNDISLPIGPFIYLGLSSVTRM